MKISLLFFVAFLTLLFKPVSEDHNEIQELGEYGGFSASMMDLESKMEAGILSEGLFDHLSKNALWVNLLPPRRVALERLREKIVKEKIGKVLLIESITESRGYFYRAGAVLFQSDKVEAVLWGPLLPYRYEGNPCANSYSWTESRTSEVFLKDGARKRLEKLAERLQSHPKELAKLTNIPALPHHPTYLVSGVGWGSKKLFSYAVHAPVIDPIGQEIDSLVVKEADKVEIKYLKQTRPVGLDIGEVFRELGLY